MTAIKCQCGSPDEFIAKIRANDLMADLNAWEHSTEANKARFKHTGWFGIAAEFWNENNLSSSGSSGRNVARESEIAGNAPHSFKMTSRFTRGAILAAKAKPEEGNI